MTEYPGLSEETLLSLFPDALSQDSSFFALAKITAAALAVRLNEIDQTRFLPNIDHLDDTLLDILANDFKVDWWDPNYSLAEKRRTLKDSWRVHRHLGTKAAVETAISAIYPNTKVQEWFQYGGKPFHFKLLIDSTYEQVDPAKHLRVLERVNYYKNLRSHLDSVEYTAVPKGTCSAFAAVAPAGFALNITVEVPVYGLG